MSQRDFFCLFVFFSPKMKTAVSKCRLRRNVTFSSEVKTSRGEVEGGNQPTRRPASQPEENSLCLTTMMAIRPPTSPTTVIGGFSLAIITAREQERRLSGEATAGGGGGRPLALRALGDQKRVSAADWVKWVEKMLICRDRQRPRNETGLDSLIG